MLWLGSDFLGLAPYLPCWPPRHRDPAWACWGWRALATRLAPVTCPLPWDGGSPRAGWGPPALPPPLRGCPPAAPLCRLPPPWGGGSASGASGDAVMGVPPSAGPRRGGGGWGLLPCPPGLGGEKREGGRRCRSSAPAQGAGGLVGGGGERDPLAVTPPPRPVLPCGASAGVGLRPCGPAPMHASFPCPALSGCRAPGLPAMEPVTRPGPRLTRPLQPKHLPWF